GNNTIYYWFRDLAGNDTNGTVYGLLDKSSPIINSIDNNNIWFKEDFNISFDVNFDISGKSEASAAKYKLNAESWRDFNEDYNILIDVDGNNTIYYWFRDLAGNDTNGTVYGLLDKSSPIINSIDNNNIWFTKDFNISFDVNFDVSGKSEAKYKLNESESWRDFNKDYNILIDVDGNYTIDYWFRDLAGNDTNGTVYGLLDKSSPIINFAIDYNNTWFREDFNISFDVNFDVSGKSEAKYKLNESESWRDFNKDYNILIDVDGNNTIDYWFRDLAGNDTNGTVYGLLDKSSPNPPSSGGRSGGSSFIYVPSGLESTDDDESESNLLTITNKDSNSINNSVDVSFVLDNVVNSQKDNLDDVISKKNISKEIKIDRIIKTDVSPVFSLEIRNDSLQSYKDLSIIEVIPKEITDHIDNLVFSIEPTNIINPDPIVEWKISELKSGGFFKINYALKEDKNIDYSVFSKWQLPLIFADDFLDYDSNYQDIEPVVEVLQKEVVLDDPNKKTTPIYDIKEKNILSWLGVLSIIILLFFILFINRPKNKKKGSRKLRSFL
ncbi:MAG: hypothetical protein PHU32_05440, partial [Candidatus ainarchaeum sp.]|nr:hypothetical protein [Candidatus ainarchaeum sp.]